MQQHDESSMVMVVVLKTLYKTGHRRATSPPQVLRGSYLSVCLQGRVDLVQVWFGYGHSWIDCVKTNLSANIFKDMYDTKLPVI